MHGEGKVTPAVRAFYAWRGGMDICLRQMRKSCEGGWTSAYGRCEKDARGGTSAYGRCEQDARGDICLRQM